ncbi:MAG TPA: NIPSNAP family protein [Gaiellaceae bacterium]|nr:NIPSNAP family protein [Gaiellaceae bacterium]
MTASSRQPAGALEVEARRLLSPIVELRRYALHPGARDELIDLFDSTFVESQELEGMAVIGQFREVDDPDAFTWLRGFPNMTERAQSLERFYTGPVWRANREQANATMIDSSNVLLLRPARPDSAFFLGDERTQRDGDPPLPGIVEATVLHLEATVDKRAVLSFFELAIADVVEAEGGRVLGYFLTEKSENTYPSLPVREGVDVFAFVCGYRGRAGGAADRERSSRVKRTAEEAPGLREPPEVIRLEPTHRSLLTAHSPECPARKSGAPDAD